MWSGTVPLVWKTGGGVLLQKRMGCGGYVSVIGGSESPGRSIRRRDWLIAYPCFRRSNMVFDPAMEQWTRATPLAGCLKVHRFIMHRLTCIFWTWRGHMTVSFVVLYEGEYRVGGHLLGTI